MRPDHDDIPDEFRIGNAHPALYIIPQAGDEENLPDVDALQETVVEAVEDKWKQAHDSVLDVRRTVVEFQDEVPPADPVPSHAIAIVFDQVPATMIYGYEGPLRVTMEAIKYEYSDIEIQIDAVPSLS